MSSKRIFISADHGLAVFYFLQSRIIPELVQAGAEVIVLTEDDSIEHIRGQFDQPGVTFEGLRIDQVQHYLRTESPGTQWWLDFLRRAGAANRINLAVVDSYVRQVKSEAHARRRKVFPIMEGVARFMRRSRPARRTLEKTQRRYTPAIYTDLFEKYQPTLVIAGSPGFRLDRYLLREAAARKITTAAAIISWDSSSSYGLPGAPVDWITCWSEIQKQELCGGADWQPEQVNIGGMPPYDRYTDAAWVMPRADYFALHGLDPNLKLLTYASSFVSWSPNIQNVEALIELVTSGQLSQPCQLLVRLHPIHMSGHYVAEADRIRELARQHRNVHVVEPAPMGVPNGRMGHYGEDVVERTSMIAHSDIFTTVYSTMCVEASFHRRPIISICIDAKEGYPGKFWVPMSQIGVWPTHSRFRESGAGRVALNAKELRQAIDDYLQNPQADQARQQAFLTQECTYTDGSASRRTAEFFLALTESQHG